MSYLKFLFFFTIACVVLYILAAIQTVEEYITLKINRLCTYIKKKESGIT
jgi:hypothetical protein